MHLLSLSSHIGEPLEIVERKIEIIMIEKKATLHLLSLSTYWGTIEIVKRKIEIIMIEKKATPASPLSAYWGLGNFKN